MTKTETVRARMEPDLKHEAEKILNKLGLNASQAITLFYRQITLRKGLPFDVRMPNAETRAAMEDARRNRNLTEWDDLDTLFRDEA